MNEGIKSNKDYRNTPLSHRMPLYGIIIGEIRSKLCKRSPQSRTEKGRNDILRNVESGW
jgi:hypothetical protein